jgi:hypothetical protein
MPFGHCIDAAKAPFNGLNEHLSNRITRKPTTRPCSPGHDLSVTAVFDKGVGHHLAGVTRDLEAIRAPAVVTVIDSYTTVVWTGRLRALRCLRQEQLCFTHDPEHALVVHAWKLLRPALTVDERARAAVSVAGQIRNLLSNVLQQLGVIGRAAMTAAIAPILRTGQPFLNVGPRYA